MMRCTALVMVMALSGCSFVFVKGPPPNHEQLPYFDCTESRAVPVLDTVFTLLQAANLLLAASTTDQEWADNFDGNPPFERSSAVPLYVVLAALGAGGMYYGFKNTGECRDARAQAQARGWSPSAPQPQPYPPQPYAPQPYAPQPAPWTPQPQPYQPQPYQPQPQPYAPQPAPWTPQPAPYAPPQQPYAPPAPPVAEPPPPEPPYAPPPPPPASPQP